MTTASSDESSVVATLISPAVLRLTLNRPKSLNAINVSLLETLIEQLRFAQDSTEIRIVIIEGSGPRSFCAGEDLKETLAPQTGSAEELRRSFERLQDITRLTSSTDKIVISAVQGFAIGGGAEIALAADFVIGGPGAKFKFPEVTLGHAVTGGISLRLTQLVGLLRAKELLLRGRFVEAPEALQIGLLSELVNDPKERAVELALELAELPAKASACSKSSLERAVFANMEAVLADEVNVANYCFAQSDAEDAFKNFRNRKETSKVSTNGAMMNGLSEESSNGIMKSIATSASINNTVSNIPDVKDLNSALSFAVKNYPHKTFIRLGGYDTTFQHFENAISKLAGGLKSLDVRSGDRVLVMMRNSLEAVHTWFATNRLGATWVPVNVELKSVTLQHVVGSAQAKVAIVDTEFKTQIESTGAFSNDHIYVNGQGSNALSSLYSSHPVETPVEVLPSAMAAFLYTSGTTGKSKPCILSHQYFIIQASELIDAFGIRSDDVLYCPFPLFHADATALTTVPALLLGATAALSPRFSASRFWDEIRETRATVYDFMGATLALTFKQEPSMRDRDHNVRLAWGVPIPHFSEDYEHRFGHKLYTLYGSVEANLPIMQKGKLPRGSCGRIRPGYHLRIANDLDEPVPPNTPGHLLLRTDKPNAFFQGYFANQESTIRAFQNLWLHTGDLAKVDGEGNVYFLGRVKDVIRRRGENINASEIEEEFLKHPDVATAAAFGIPSDLGSGTEEDVKVAVQLRHQNSGISEEDLWNWSKLHMARFQVPSVIQLVTELKRTPTGKVEKQSLAIEGGKRFDIRRGL